MSKIKFRNPYEFRQLFLSPDATRPLLILIGDSLANGVTPLREEDHGTTHAGEIFHPVYQEYRSLRRGINNNLEAQLYGSTTTGGCEADLVDGYFERTQEPPLLIKFGVNGSTASVNLGDYNDWAVDDLLPIFLQNFLGPGLILEARPVGIICSLGTNDLSHSNTYNYEGSIRSIHWTITSVTGPVPFALWQVSSKIQAPGVGRLQRYQARVVDDMKNFALVETDDLELFDGVHFDHDSNTALASRTLTALGI